MQTGSYVISPHNTRFRLLFKYIDINNYTVFPKDVAAFEVFLKRSVIFELVAHYTNMTKATLL